MYIDMAIGGLIWTAIVVVIVIIIIVVLLKLVFSVIAIGPIALDPHRNEIQTIMIMFVKASP
jgi:hypothetical protein